ncbi:MAG TPA: MarR family transcriptional regulator [Acidimicrobiales bacterium]
MTPSDASAASGGRAEDGDAGGGRAKGMPLARLFAMAFRQVIDELHTRLADRGWTAMRPPYGFVLVAASHGPLNGAAIADLMGMTKQGASKLIDAMEADGYVRREPGGAGDGRSKQVALTARGRRLLDEVEAIYADIEAEWADVVGRDRVEAIRDDLLAVLRAAHGGRLPPIRPTW